MRKMYKLASSKLPGRMILAVLILALLGSTPQSASAFNVSIHEDITTDGLAQRLASGGFRSSFLRRAVLDDIKDEHAQMDESFSGAEDEKHFDDCEFNGAVEFINGQHYRASQLATPGGDFIPFVGNFDPWEATDSFGSLLHTVMDFYSHSNWVELGFPQHDDPGTLKIEIEQSDLVDLSGAPFSNLQDWFVPPPLGAIRDDILLHADDHLTLPAGWSVDEDFPGAFQATLRDENGLAVGRLLTTGKGTGDSECNISVDELPDVIVWTGFEHDDLNKDGPSGTPTVNLKHQRARALATLQTSYEWCRFIYKTGLLGGEGVPIALWVKRDGSPHPQLTPCAPEPPGHEEVTVTIDSVRVLDSGDDADNQPGEINLVLVVYDSPFTFHRSARSQSEQVRVHEGDFIDPTRLPHQVTLCLGEEDTTFRLAVHGWDDDDDSTDPFYVTGDFDDIGDDDEVLLGFQQTWELNPPTAPQTVVSDDLEVTYRMEVGTDSDSDGLGDCDEQIIGSDSDNADSDDDGLSDGTEVNGSNPTNPLDSDSDDDGLTDGQEDVNLNGGLDPGETNPNNADSDDDGLNDGVEVDGTNPTNPLDSDSDDDGLADGQEDTNANGLLDFGETNPNDADSDEDGLLDGVEVNLGTDPLDADTDSDELLDGQEVNVGTDPLDSDSDDDGILDGEDVEWLQAAISSLPPEAFKNTSHGLQTALLSILNNAERFIVRGQNIKATQKLQTLRTRVDGCGSTPDQTDWIVECAAQIQIRNFLDLLIINLY